METNVNYLDTIYDSRKSFYNKAMVKTVKNLKTLYSYNTVIATINTDLRQVTLTEAWKHSATTLRHLKEFLKQNDFTADTKKQIELDYA